MVKSQHANKDVLQQHHQHQQIHVIANLFQFKNVEMDQLQELLLAEIMKLQHVDKDVHQHQQIHVIAKLLQ
jgi:hypothetical protein